MRPVVTRISVRVRPEADGSHLVIERGDGSHRIDVSIDDADPVIADSLRHRLNDFVAGCIASALSQLNAEMQRRIGRP